MTIYIILYLCSKSHCGRLQATSRTVRQRYGNPQEDSPKCQARQQVGARSARNATFRLEWSSLHLFQADRQRIQRLRSHASPRAIRADVSATAAAESSNKCHCILEHWLQQFRKATTLFVVSINLRAYSASVKWCHKWRKILLRGVANASELV